MAKIIICRCGQSVQILERINRCKCGEPHIGKLTERLEALG